MTLLYGVSAEVMAVVHEPSVLLNRDRIRFRGQGVRIDSFCKIEGGLGVEIGRFVHVASFCHLNIGGGSLALGDYSTCASSVKIVTGSNEIESLCCNTTAPEELQSVRRGFVVVKEYAFLCTGVVVLPDVTIGEGAVAAAGAVVRQDIPPWEIWAGCPARKVGVRELKPEHREAYRSRA